MEQELTGLWTGSFQKLRVYQNDAMRDILDLISSPGGVPTVVSAGSGISVAGVSDKHFVISTTAQAQTRNDGSDGAVQTAYVNDGAGTEQAYTASQVQGLRFTGALGQLVNGTLTVSGLKGADGDDVKLSLVGVRVGGHDKTARHLPSSRPKIGPRVLQHKESSGCKKTHAQNDT